MATVLIGATIKETLKTAIERYCKSHGIVVDHFIQEALFDRLEELQDIEDLEQVRHELTRPLAEVLQDIYRPQYPTNKRRQRAGGT